MGRPSEFSDDAVSAICDEIASGGTLKSAAERAKVSVEAIKRWLRADEVFRAQYTQAREDQADAFADDILDTARDGGLEPNDRRVRIDALKWLAGKRKPKVYGDKVTLGGDAENPVNSVVTHRIDDDTIERVRARLRGR